MTALCACPDCRRDRSQLIAPLTSPAETIVRLRPILGRSVSSRVSTDYPLPVWIFRDTSRELANPISVNVCFAPGVLRSSAAISPPVFP